MDEYVLAAITSNKTKTLAGIEPFDVATFPLCMVAELGIVVEAVAGTSAAPEGGN